MWIKLEEELRRIGLNDKEAKLYLAGLKLGSASVMGLAEEANIKRSTCYTLMESLLGKGLAFEEKRGKKKVYRMEDPDNLNKLITKAREKVIRLEEALGGLVPELKAISYKTIDLPQAKIFEGAEGIQGIFRDIYEERLDVFIFGSQERMADSPIFFDQLRNLAEKRRGQGNKVIVLTDGEDERLVKMVNESFIAVKILSGKIESKTIMMLYDNKVALIPANDRLVAIIIRNMIMVEMLMVMWRMLSSQATNMIGVGQQNQIF